MSRTDSTVEDILTAMAYNREEFKNKLEEKIGGALLEHYKAALAAGAGQTRWVRHWESEVDRLIGSELVVVLLHSIKGFKDRRKAAAEVVQHLRGLDEQYRRAAQRVVKRDYALKKLATKITDEATERFYDLVQEAIDTYT